MPITSFAFGSVLVPHPLEELMDITLTEAQDNQFLAVMKYISPATHKALWNVKFHSEKIKKPQTQYRVVKGIVPNAPLFLSLNSGKSQPNSSMHNSSPHKVSSASHTCEIPRLVGAQVLQFHFVTHSVMTVQLNNHSSTDPAPAFSYSCPYLSRQTPSPVNQWK